MDDEYVEAWVEGYQAAEADLITAMNLVKHGLELDILTQDEIDAVHYTAEEILKNFSLVSEAKAS